MKKLIQLLIIILIVLVSCKKEQQANIVSKIETIKFSKFTCGTILSPLHPKIDIRNNKTLDATKPCIFLDFDGHTITDPAWTESNNGNPIVCTPSGMTDLQKIQCLAWLADAIPNWNVEVTSDETTYLNDNPSRRVRIVITANTPSCFVSLDRSGLGMYNTFTSGTTDAGALIFLDHFTFSNGAAIVGVIEHEWGHTMGLYHQSKYNLSCIKTDEYYPIIGSGQGDSWGPIMGTGGDISTFAVGPDNSGCNSQVDEGWYIQNLCGVAPDDIGYGFDFAYSIQPPFVNFTRQLGSEYDHDMYYLSSPLNGSFHISVTALGGSVDLKVDLYRADHSFYRSYDVDNNYNIPYTFVTSNGTSIRYIDVYPTHGNSNIRANSYQQGYYQLTIN